MRVRLRDVSTQYGHANHSSYYKNNDPRFTADGTVIVKLEVQSTTEFAERLFKASRTGFLDVFETDNPDNVGDDTTRLIKETQALRLEATKLRKRVAQLEKEARKWPTPREGLAELVDVTPENRLVVPTHFSVFAGGDPTRVTRTALAQLARLAVGYLRHDDLGFAPAPLPYPLNDEAMRSFEPTLRHVQAAHLEPLPAWMQNPALMRSTMPVAATLVHRWRGIPTRAE